MKQADLGVTSSAAKQKAEDAQGTLLEHCSLKQGGLSHTKYEYVTLSS